MPRPGNVRPQRLSQWLVERGARTDDYLPGTLWRVDDEVPRQQALRLELRADLLQLARRPTAAAGSDSGSGSDSKSPGPGDANSAGDRQRREAAARMLRWMDRLPVTGRVPLRSADARWLEANPAHDPMLGEGSRASVPARPATVTVITPEGLRCQVPHRPMAEALAYVEACSGREAAAQVDHAWVVQPDGRIQRSGVAQWNAQAQLPPAPGAWIWAPPRNQRWPDATSARIAARLATQGPVADVVAEGGPVPADGSARGTVAGDTLPEIRSANTPPLPRPPARDLPVTASDWGVVGLLQTPSARMQPTGFFGFTASRTPPYTHATVSLQPLQWLEVAFRYSNLGTALYGPQIAGDQSYKDKSIDLKALLWEESAHLPALAVGFRDLTGTGKFSGEYLVASKRTGAVDWSLGLGWGYVGARGNLPNPLGSNNRPPIDFGQGGQFSFGTYFRGRTSLFGGVQWQTPWAPLVLKLEYDGNDYQREPFGERFVQRSPFNVGVVYRVNPHVDLTLGYERGDRIMLGFSINAQLDGLRMPKTGDAPRVPVARERPQPVVAPQADAVPAPAPAAAPGSMASASAGQAEGATPPTLRPALDWQPTREALRVQTQWHAARFDLRGRELRVTFDDAEAGYWHDRVDRAASVLHRDAPGEVDRFVLAYRQRGSVMAEHVVDRDAWVRERFELLPPREQRPSVMARAPSARSSADARESSRDGGDARVSSQARGSSGWASGDTLSPSATAPSVAAPASRASAPVDVNPPRFEHGLSLALRTSFGGPDAFLLYQVSAVEQFRWRLRADTWLQGTVALGLVDNYDRFSYTAPSDLPRVRTYLREYITSTSLTLPNLQVTHVGHPSRDHFYSVYGGYLESMFAGVGGEWLYRPFGSRVALGIDANFVRQRSFEQDFSFDNAGAQTGYQVATGHATLYWDTGWNDVRALVAAGRYLAGDIGATFQVSRGFDNGVTVGAFFTKTNVSSERFGEGSFDKGIFVRVPFDAFLMRSSARTGTFLYQPLTRDGGARLNRAVQLIQHTTLRDEHGLRIRAPGTPDPATGHATEGRVDAARDPAEQADRWLRRQDEGEARTRVVPRELSEADRRRASAGADLPDPSRVHATGAVTGPGEGAAGMTDPLRSPRGLASGDMRPAPAVGMPVGGETRAPGIAGAATGDPGRLRAARGTPAAPGADTFEALDAQLYAQGFRDI
ncbi:MAG: YjbH domain-containing protein, partial [Pseudomonadota bacterium]